MKKNLQVLISLISAVIILLCSGFNVLAETVYTYKGYSYTILYDNYISICGWDNRSTDFVVPAQLDGSYIKEIADMGMRNNEYITSVDMSRAGYLTRIGNMAFKGCTGLNGNISIPSRITEIGYEAFQECSGITSFDYYSDIPVPEQCCYKCTNLKKATISQGVKSINKLAFADCSSLNYVRIPNSVTDIKMSAFKNSPNVVIYCYKGSYAEQFAKDNGYKYYIIDLLYGDANSDSIVNILDVTYIQKHLLNISGYELNEEYQRFCADVNHDGSITVRDATLIQMKIAKYNVDF